MDRGTAAAGTAVFAATVPVTVAGLVPWWLAGRPSSPPSSAPVAARIVGAGLVLGGSLLVGTSFLRFVRARGTPAPIAETASHEEPRLRRRFPAEYARFTAEVPRWLPRPAVNRDR